MRRRRIEAADVGLEPPRRRHKYGAVPTEVDGIRFDSRAEARHYEQLCLREQANEIVDLRRQVPFPVTINDVHVCTYLCDFSYYDVVEQRERFIDVKGYDTPASKIKRRLVLAAYGVDVELVREGSKR